MVRTEEVETSRGVLAGGSGSVSISLHPLVILNISEHWTRTRAQRKTNVQGTKLPIPATIAATMRHVYYLLCAMSPSAKALRFVNKIPKISNFCKIWCNKSRATLGKILSGVGSRYSGVGQVFVLIQRVWILSTSEFWRLNQERLSSWIAIQSSIPKCWSVDTRVSRIAES